MPGEGEHEDDRHHTAGDGDPYERHRPGRVHRAEVVADDHAVGATSIGLLGFSQGAAIALQALRLQPERFAFAVNLSGYASAGELPGDAVLAASRPPVFWGRGTHDDVIPEHLVAQTTEWLPAHSTLSGSVYPGLTHSVSQAELDDVRGFLEARLKDAST